MVRAINADGRLSPNVAAVSFEMLPPFWRRWWFLSSTALLVIGLAFWAYHARVERLLYLERVRTRIATDLHDDIGSSLTQIAVMSEAAQRAPNEAQALEPLTRIAELSRELIDNLSDIVWAINPQRDTLGDLTYRMRRFASDIFTSNGVRLKFVAPSDGAGISLPADFRREVFLVFKESVNNIARHSGCTDAEVLLELDGLRMTLTVSDNGVGFETGKDGTERGHGLASIAERARRVSGQLTIASSPGEGTRVVLQTGIR
jgi:signal transduction histidine kinase